MRGPGEAGTGTLTGRDWRRSNARMLAVFALKQLKGLIPLLVLVFLGGRDDTTWRVGGAVLVLALVVGAGVVRWLTVRYRVDAERVELRTGLLNRQHRSLRRDRVRTVDLTASLIHRLLGLSVVEIGTGSRSSSEGSLSLDAVTHSEANLGHALASEYLVIGLPSVTRRRIALQRRGVIGWRLRQSVFQRHAGLVTLDVVTAAGRGRYSVVDVPMARALRLVDTVDPGLLPIGASAATSNGPVSASAATGAEQPTGDLPAQ